ncbi:MAG: hypothetical protein C0497_01785 [Gemmatimonas sp.]|nr:hypothetical protein [Gemmatimonas sp.]
MGEVRPLAMPWHPGDHLPPAPALTMQPPATPTTETARVAVLHGLAVLDTPAEERFDAITQTVRQLFGVPIALVSLVDVSRQWFKSRQGLDASETPRDVSFCGHAILGDEVFVVENALADARFRDNPLVTGPPHVVFYAGMPLSTPDGHKVGTLCIIDHVPRTFTASEAGQLRAIARWAERELMVTQERAAVAQGREMQRYLEAVRDHVIDGLITITERGIVEYLNPAASRMFGYSAPEVIGQNVRMLMPEPYHSEHDGYLHRFATTGERRVIGIGRTVVGRRKDGTTFPMELAVSEVPVASGRRYAGITRDISERKATEEQLHQTLSLQRAILDGAAYSIISTDPHGEILTFNPAAERMLGYAADEIVRKTSPAIFHDSEEVAARAAELTAELGRPVAPGFEAFVSKAVLGPPDEREWTYIRKDGSRFRVLLSITTLRNRDGSVLGFLGIGYDLTERESLERAKEEFISTVSHELRTPLTSIVGSLGLVTGGAAGELPPKATTLLDIAHNNAKRLVRLINDMLDLDKVASGRMRFELRSHALAPLLTQAIEANRAYAAPLGVELALDQRVPDVEVSVDADRFQQVLSNLLSNAAKFSPAGSVVSLTARFAAGRLAVAVQDRGRGIPGEYHDRVFQKFWQADSSDTRQKGGTGLGLSITKALVEGMHGNIEFESVPGVGTTFTFRLPATPVARGLMPVVASPALGGRPRVLVCEDDVDVAHLLQMMLEEDGYAVAVAYDAEQAVERLATATYDAVTVDIGLPGGRSGLDLIRDMRANPATTDVPVIVVSANASSGRLALSGGFVIVDWIGKPIDRVRLAAALRRATAEMGGRARVLHVEDDDDLREVVRSLLADIANVTPVATLTEAQAALRRERFDLILLDLGLPDGPGQELLATVNRLVPPPSVLVFAGTDIPVDVEAMVAATLAKATTTNDQLLATIRRLAFTTFGAPGQEPGGTLSTGD